jgi:hypothetical protein
VALDQSALLEVLDALKAAEVDDRIRQAAQTIYQALIEAELTAVIGAAPHERDAGAVAPAQRPPLAPVDDLGWGSGAARPQAAGRVVFPLACWSGAGGSTRRCSRW